ncbi:MAG: DUF2442 domain-containing protein [Mariprofundales bacterium]
MKSLALGNSILEAEVTHISSHGIWLLTHDKELFLSYEEFPWFKDQPVKSIINVTEQGEDRFYWPDIDVDLTTESIEHPERFPLKANVTTQGRSEQ